ncbi:MAG: ribonuclease III [Lachnospiraceae bacterium]|nr:ribonuclease III [Lachnospiraceae bacterium]
MKLFRRKGKNEAAAAPEPVYEPLDTVSFRDAVISALKLRCPEDPELLKPLELAYLGDNVYETINRLLAVTGPGRSMAEIHRASTERARAESQAKIAESLQDVFTEEERKIYLRARNAHVGTRTRSASSGEYHKATGLEAVFGFLYLQGRYDRIAWLFRTGAEKAGISLR